MVGCWRVSGQAADSSSESEARAELWQHSGTDLEVFPAWPRDSEPGSWLTNTSYSFVERHSRSKHRFFFTHVLLCILPLVLIAVSILAASLSGLKSIAGTTVGNLGSLAWGLEVWGKDNSSINNMQWIQQTEYFPKWKFKKRDEMKKQSTALPRCWGTVVRGTLTP